MNKQQIKRETREMGEKKDRKRTEETKEENIKALRKRKPTKQNDKRFNKTPQPNK